MMTSLTSLSRSNYVCTELLYIAKSSLRVDVCLIIIKRNQRMYPIFSFGKNFKNLDEWAAY